MMTLAVPRPTLQRHGAEFQRLVEHGLRSSFWTLSLPGELEAQYHRDMLDARVAHLERSGWFALLVFNSFLVVDWLMANDVFWLAVFVRVCVFTPLGVATLLATHYGRHLISRERQMWLLDWIVVFSGWGAALSLAFILYKSHSPWVGYYHAGFLVVVIYGNLVQQLSFRHAILFSVMVLLLHIAGIAQVAVDFPLAVKVALVQLLGFTCAFTLLANYLLGKAARRRYLLLQRDQQLAHELSELHHKLQHLSRSDVLTGVANRRHFRDYLQQVCERAAIDETPVSVLMLDVDHFKAYNDRYGHPAGDDCLRRVALALEAHLRRPGDLVARYGGEEFVVVLPHAEADVARQAGERIRQAVEDLALPHEASPTGRVVTISVGVATASSVDKTPVVPDILVSRADQALYTAKRGGRNTVGVAA